MKADRDDPWTEPGRHVDEETGAIVTHWPPEGRFKVLWERFHAEVPDDEKSDVLALLRAWQDENSTLDSYTNDGGEWVDVRPDWSVPGEWLGG